MNFTEFFINSCCIEILEITRFLKLPVSGELRFIPYQNQIILKFKYILIITYGRFDEFIDQT